MKYLPIAFVAAVLLLSGEARASTSSSGSTVVTDEGHCGAVSMHHVSTPANRMSSCADVATQQVRTSGCATGATDLRTSNPGDKAPAAKDRGAQEFERGNTGGRG